MTFDDRAQAVMALGFTERQARFLATVALHSGYCLRRQYEAFAGIRSGKAVSTFLDGLVTCGVAERFAGRADRGHVYHVRGRALYSAIGENDNRHGRPASAAQIARRLMLLDVVIGRRDVAWFATERDKVQLFVDRFGVPAQMLPRRMTRKVPIFLSTEGVPHFVYLAAGGSSSAFATFLRDHAALLRCLPRWAVLAVGVSRPPGLQIVFDAFAKSSIATLSAAHDELPWYFDRRRLVDNGDLAQVPVRDLRRFRALRQRFDSPAHERLYAQWLATGRIDAATPGSPTGDSIGTLMTELLPSAYEQFGSLPGVA